MRTERAGSNSRTMDSKRPCVQYRARLSHERFDRKDRFAAGVHSRTQRSVARCARRDDTRSESTHRSHRSICRRRSSVRAWPSSRKYDAVLEADGTPMTVRTALQLINRFLAEDDFDADTQFCLHWFEQYGWEAGKFGEADTLARAKGTSVDGVKQSGVLIPSAATCDCSNGLSTQQTGTRKPISDCPSGKFCIN